MMYEVVGLISDMLLSDVFPLFIPIVISNSRLKCLVKISYQPFKLHY
jgi:hypothetical protein